MEDDHQPTFYIGLYFANNSFVCLLRMWGDALKPLQMENSISLPNPGNICTLFALQCGDALPVNYLKALFLIDVVADKKNNFSASDSL